MSKFIGDVSAYAYAVSKGYTGTEEEFAELMASYADVGQTAVDAKDAAVAAKTAAQTAATIATNKASEATTAAQTATTKAGEASQSASTATSAKDTAVSASQTATSKATEATTAAGTATTAKDDAVTAKTAAETAQGKAEDAQAAAEAVAESIPSDYSQLSEDVTELKSDLSDLNDYKFDELFSELDVSNQQNLYDTSTATNGYIASNGNISSSDTYCYSSKIPVKVGNTYSFWALYNGNVVSANARFLCAYDSENNAVSASGSNSSVASYTVPNGIASIVVSFEQNRKHLFMVVEGTTQPESLLPYNLEHYIAKESFVRSAFGNLMRGNESIKMAVATAESGVQYDLIDHLDNKKNCSYSFFGKFSSFTSVQIGHGKTETGACYMIIDGTNITSYKPDGTAYATVLHGLTITDFIAVSIKVADTKAARARVTIITNSGSVTVGNIIFFGCNGKVHFQCGQETTDVEFVYNIMDLRKDVFVFGDSYTSLADDKRWTEYAITENDNNILISGFAGANSQEEYPSFVNITSMKQPKYICWFLGMNDKDSTSSINANWYEMAQRVLSYCDLNGIVPILATIPNTPTQNNFLKNEWVKNSGRRYVDFAKAVGAEELGSSWYTGMLSSDNVHPTAEGAKALWLRLRLDVPEIMERITT